MQERSTLFVFSVPSHFGGRQRFASIADGVQWSSYPGWWLVSLLCVWMIWQVQSQNWAMEAVLQALSWLLVVLLQAELIVITWQVNSEH
jgi:hypothetical protein